MKKKTKKKPITLKKLQLVNQQCLEIQHQREIKKHFLDSQWFLNYYVPHFSGLGTAFSAGTFFLVL